MLTRLWQLIKEMFICSRYHKDANVKKLEQKSLQHWRTREGTQLLPTHFVWSCVTSSAQTHSSDSRCGLKWKWKHPIYIWNSSSSTFNKTCFYLGTFCCRKVLFKKAELHVGMLTDFRNNVHAVSIMSKSGLFQCKKSCAEINNIEPVFLPGPVLVQASFDHASDCLCPTDGFWKNFRLFSFTRVKQYCNDPREPMEPSNS